MEKIILSEENKFSERFCLRCGDIFKKTKKYQKSCINCRINRGMAKNKYITSDKEREEIYLETLQILKNETTIN